MLAVLGWRHDAAGFPSVAGLPASVMGLFGTVLERAVIRPSWTASLSIVMLTIVMGMCCAGWSLDPNSAPTPHAAVRTGHFATPGGRCNADHLVVSIPGGCFCAFRHVPSAAACSSISQNHWRRTHVIPMRRLTGLACGRRPCGCGCLRCWAHHLCPNMAHRAQGLSAAVVGGFGTCPGLVAGWSSSLLNHVGFICPGFTDTGRTSWCPQGW